MVGRIKLVYIGVLCCACYVYSAEAQTTYQRQNQNVLFHPDVTNEMTAVLAEVDSTQHTNSSKQTCLLIMKVLNPSRIDLQTLLCLQACSTLSVSSGADCHSWSQPAPSILV